MDDRRMLEPDGGNLYRPHPMMIHSGRFWRCAHDTTGFATGMVWVGCDACAAADPAAFAAWHRTDATTTAAAIGEQMEKEQQHGT